MKKLIYKKKNRLKIYTQIVIIMSLQSTKNYKLVSIEGNIGAGKSTLLRYIAAECGSNPNIIFLQEPVDKWATIKDTNGDTMLQMFYANPKTYAFPFQMMAYISRLQILRNAVKYVATKPEEQFIIITERSLYTDKYVFAQMLYDQKDIEDVCYQIYLEWFNEFADDFPIEYTIYVKATPDKCYERVNLRNREGEEVIPLAYLENCHNYHEAFLDPKQGITNKLLTLDGNIDIYQNKKALDLWWHDITHFVGI